MALNEEKFKDFINSCRDFNSFVGTKVRQVHEGTSVLEVEMRKELCNRWGIPHGGVVFTLADTGTEVVVTGFPYQHSRISSGNPIYIVSLADGNGKLTEQFDILLLIFQ